MIPFDLHYVFPNGVYFIFITVLLLGAAWRLFNYRNRVLTNFAGSQVLSHVVVSRSRFNFWMKTFSFCIVWTAATLAMMQPEGNGHYPLEKGMVDTKRKAHDVILLVDASASMGAPDTRTGVSRLDYAKEIADQIISRLGGESVSLHAFTSETTKLSPATMDYLFVRLMLRQMGINEGDIAGTDLKKALENMRREYFSDVSSKFRTLILLTDGGDEENKTILDTLDHAPELNLRVFTIGMGSREGEQVPGIAENVKSSLNETLLRQIAQKGRGRYYFANETTPYALSQDLAHLIASEKIPLEKIPFSQMTLGKDDIVYDPYFQFPLGIALFLLVLALFFPDSRKKSALLLPFSLIFPLMGQQEYFEAGDYDRAIESYEERESERLQDWQKNRLIYNLATIYLEKGDYDQTLNLLDEIEAPSPILKERIRLNRAVASYRKARDLLNSTPRSDTTYRRAIFFFREAADSPDPELYQSAKSELAALLKEYTDFLVRDASSREGIPLLLSGVKTTLSNMEFLETKTFKNEYFQWVVKGVKEWVPFWEAQVEEMPELFDAEQEYNLGLLSLENREYEKSRQAFTNSASKLMAIMQKMWGDDPVIEVLQSLLISYYRALVQVPLQEASLYRLQTEQKQLHALMESNPNLEQGDRMLEKSLEAIRKGGLKEGRIYAEEGRQSIRRMVRTMDEMTPETILEAAIQDQEHALSVNSLSSSLSEPPPPIKQSQTEVLKTASAFVPEVLAFQKKHASVKCQCTPWKTVIPLFFSGLQAAKEAEMTLSAAYQDQAVDFWREALNQLKGVVQEKEKTPEPAPAPEISVKDVLRELQQMEQQDRAPREKRPVSKEGVKPW